MVDASKTTVSEAIGAIDKKDKKKMLVSTKYDTAYTDGAKFTFTKIDSIHLAADYAGKSKSIAYILPKKDNPAILDTVIVKAKAATAVVLNEGITYVMAEKKSVKQGVVIEKSLGGNTYWKFILLVFVQIIFVTMVYGPMAAFLVELFPTKIRYTSMSLPYHIGNGVFGGLVPFLGTLIVEFTKTPQNPGGDPLAGLWYPIGIATLCLIIGTIYLTNKIDNDVMD
jgi:hypothetical protein